MRAILISAVLLTSLASGPALADPGKDRAQADIWAKEQMIYRERGRGNMQPYIDGIAADYLAWPPFRPAPAGLGGLEELKKKMVVDNQEVLAMNFKGFALNGDAAIIYYQTHRTKLPNGTPVDEYFDVTHSWVLQGGQWKVFGGMARATPK